MTNKKNKPKPQDKEPTHCVSCGDYIKGDSRSTSNKMYCNDCGSWTSINYLLVLIYRAAKCRAVLHITCDKMSQRQNVAGACGAGTIPLASLAGDSLASLARSFDRGTRLIW